MRHLKMQINHILTELRALILFCLLRKVKKVNLIQNFKNNLLNQVKLWPLICKKSFGMPM